MFSLSSAKPQLCTHVSKTGVEPETAGARTRIILIRLQTLSSIY